MNDSALKGFCVDARRDLMDGVRQCLRAWGVAADADPAAIVWEGHPLTATERGQRAELIRKVRQMGEEALVEQAAYTWFNRLMAMRYMELHELLPCGVRMLSANDGSFNPQAIREALALDIEGLDRAEVAELVRAGDDEALWQRLFLAECNELAACMPDVFEPVGAPMELLLPRGLLRQGSVLERMVTCIPERDWREGVEIVGWMYQHYNAERKDEAFAGFKKGKKADASTLAPATQLFTPHWIVRYLTENSLGRYWMQGHPDSRLPERMPYFIPDQVEEGAAPLECAPMGPEGISVIDPACGSAHILVYAFDLLAAMYEEAGYGRREIPQLVLQKNLVGIEIDPRAAAIASFALAMKACEYDSRFLRRGVRPDVTVLRQVDLTEEELACAPQLGERKAMLDAMAHMDECGSLFVPKEADIRALEDAEAMLDAKAATGDVFAGSALEKVRIMRANCKPLARTYDVVIANPPYMGSSNMDKWLVNWTKKNYPDSKRDLCTCFIEQGFTLAEPDGYSALITMQSWMFLGSFEQLRGKVLDNCFIVSMAHLGARAFDSIGGEVVSTTATVFGKSASDGLASFLRLVDIDGEAAKDEAIRTAIADPECGWFYRRSADDFSAIPGTPIAYWASISTRKAFLLGKSLSSIATPRQGLATSDNQRFLRKWWELSQADINRVCGSREEASESGFRWFPIIRGGSYRKWWGEYDEVVDWFEDGEEMKAAVLKKYPYLSNPNFVIKNQQDYFKPAVNWSKISSSDISFRYAPPGMLFEVAGACMFSDDATLAYLQGLCNSSSMYEIASILSPTLNFEVGQIATYPILESEKKMPLVLALVEEAREFSKSEYDSFEASWDFKRHPMV